jgi:hypothetical protein
MCNVPQLNLNEAELLKRFVEKGGHGLIIFLGDRVLADAYNQSLAELLPARLGPIAGDKIYGLDPLGYQHPVVAPFRGQHEAGLLTTTVNRYFRLEVAADRARTEVAAALTSGDPLIVTAPVGRGRVALVATAGSLASIDPATGEPWTTMPAWPSFLPIVRELLANVIGGQHPSHLVGESIGAGMELASGAEQLSVTRPDGGVESVDVIGGTQGPSWSYTNTDLSGVYSLRVDDSDVSAFTVNVDRAESELARVGATELPLPFSVRTDPAVVGDASASYGQPSTDGRLSWLLLVAAIVFALLDTTLGAWFGRGSA